MLGFKLICVSWGLNKMDMKKYIHKMVAIWSQPPFVKAKTSSLRHILPIHSLRYLFTSHSTRERERERLSLSAFLRTEDIGVHIVHSTSRLINNLRNYYVNLIIAVYWFIITLGQTFNCGWLFYWSDYSKFLYFNCCILILWFLEVLLIGNIHW